MYNGQQTRKQVYLNTGGRINRQASYHQYKKQQQGKITRNYADLSKQSSFFNRASQYTRHISKPVHQNSERVRFQEMKPPQQENNIVRGQKYNNQNYDSYRKYTRQENLSQKYGRNNFQQTNKLSLKNSDLYGVKSRQYLKQQKQQNVIYAQRQTYNYNGHPSRTAHEQQLAKNIKHSPRNYSQFASKYQQTAGINANKQGNFNQSDRCRQLLRKNYQYQQKQNHNVNEEDAPKYDQSEKNTYSYKNTPNRVQKDQKQRNQYTPQSVCKSKQRRQNLINRSKMLQQRMIQLSAKSENFYQQNSRGQDKPITPQNFDKYSRNTKCESTNRQRLQRLRQQPQQRAIHSPFKESVGQYSKRKQRYNRQMLQTQNTISSYQNNRQESRQLEKWNNEHLKDQKKQNQRQYRRSALKDYNRTQMGLDQKVTKQNHHSQVPSQNNNNFHRMKPKDSECMNRISMLNKKINERINSIISSYGPK